MEKKQGKKEHHVVHKEHKAQVIVDSTDGEEIIKVGFSDFEGSRTEKKKKKKIDYKKILKDTAPLAGVSLAIALITLLFAREFVPTLVAFIVTFLVLEIYLSTKKKLVDSDRIKKMEAVFPDFIELVASNLRAGMTVERSLMLSSRKEFSPLDTEVLELGKSILTGKKVHVSLLEMAKRIKSEKITKTIGLIITGLRSGGNLAILLEETAQNMRERAFVEKRAASNVLMYVIFIVFAVGVGAPILFSLSTVLVQVLTEILQDIPTSTVSSQVSIPFTLTKINVSVTFVMYFAVFFMLISTFLASMVLGLVSKGQEKEGIKYSVPLMACALFVFFVIKIVLTKYFAGLF